MTTHEQREEKITHFAEQELANYNKDRDSHFDHCPSCGLVGIENRSRHAKECWFLRNDIRQELEEAGRL